MGTHKWVKETAPYLIGVRNNIHIFDLESTLICLKQVCSVLLNIKKKNGHILFVNTVHKYKELVKITAQNSNQKCSYINDRWIGGTLTNWKQLSESIALYQKFSFLFESFLKQKNINIPIYNKSKRRYAGLQTHSVSQTTPSGLRPAELRGAGPTWGLPDLIILTNSEENPQVIQEANRFLIPLISFVDTGKASAKLSANSSLRRSDTRETQIQYSIPGNNKSMSFMYFCFNLFSIILNRESI